MDLAEGTYRVTRLFVKCLAALPNLHALEIVAMSKFEVIDAFEISLEKEKPLLHQLRTLTLPPVGHRLLLCCPNIEDLTCCCTPPDEDLVESLVASRLNHITRFSLMSLGENIWPSRFFVPRSLPVRWAHGNSHRGGDGLSGDSRIVCLVCESKLREPRPHSSH